MASDTIKTVVLVNPKTGKPDNFVSGTVAGQLLMQHLKQNFRFHRSQDLYAKYTQLQTTLKVNVVALKSGEGHGARYMYSLNSLKQYLGKLV